MTGKIYRIEGRLFAIAKEVLEIANDFYKRCGCCGKFQRWTEFASTLARSKYKSKREVRYLQSWCADCNRAARLRRLGRRRAKMLIGSDHRKRFINNLEMWQCTRCRRFLALHEFRKRKERGFRPQSHCKRCQRRADQKRYYRRKYAPPNTIHLKAKRKIEHV